MGTKFDGFPQMVTDGSAAFNSTDWRVILYDDNSGANPPTAAMVSVSDLPGDEIDSELLTNKTVTGEKWDADTTVFAGITADITHVILIKGNAGGADLLAIFWAITPISPVAQQVNVNWHASGIVAFA